MNNFGSPVFVRAAPGGGHENGEIRAMRRLWQGVMVQMFLCAAGGTKTSAETPSGRDLAVHQARSWLRSRHFREVAELAGFDPEAAQQGAARFADAGYPRSAFPLCFKMPRRKTRRLANRMGAAA